MAFFSTEKMTETDSIAAFCDGAKKAISAANELARDTGNTSWLDIAGTLDGMRENGYKLAHMKAMREFETKAAIDFKLGKHVEQSRPINMNPLKKR